ncbi:MAG: RIP metalloprotease RseP [Thermodesulfobacteriota bacterium]|jgi:regulator of sigma E protease
MDLSTLDVILKVVLVFGLIVFVHELGHFLAAKWVGVGVERFSFGFGPKLVGKRIGETEYMVSAIPLGGYVKMVGEDVGEEVSAADVKRSFAHQPLPGRFLIVLAGPFANLLTAFVVFSVTFFSFGVNVPVDEATVGGVVPGLPAQKAGLESGDEVLQVGGVPVRTWEELAQRIQQSEGKAIPLTVKKPDGRVVDVTITPELRSDPVAGAGEANYVIGIERVFRLEEVSFGRAVQLGAEQTWLWTALIVKSVAMLLSGEVSTKELGGPILIAQVAGQQARLGLDYLLRFTAIINVNLAVFNLLPIPVLDGGHLLLFLIELVRGRPLSLRSREVAWRVGFLVIVTLIVLVFYNDIARLVG